MLRRLACLVPVLSLSSGAAALVVGCTNDSVSAPPGVDAASPDVSIPRTDAGPKLDSAVPDSSVPDATLPDSAIPDSAVPDSPAADVVDAGPPPVSVTVTLASGAPEQGVNVVFQDATGAVVTTLVTDVTGKVSSVALAGTMVTAVMGPSFAPQLVTIMGVQPGDNLIAVDPTGTTFDPFPATVTALPDTNVQPGVFYYNSWTGPGCGYSFQPSSLPYDLTVYEGCAAGSHFSFLAEGLDESSTAIEFAFQKNVPWTVANGGGSFAVTGAWGIPGPQTVTVTNAPDLGFPFESRLIYNEVAGGVPFNTNNGQAFTLASDAGVESRSYLTHPGFGDFVQTEANVVNFALNGYSAISGTAIATRAAETTDGGVAAAFDLSQLLPQLTDATLDTSDGGAPARPITTWTSASPVTGADGIIVNITWSQAQDDGGSVQGTWTVIAPPDATSVQFPALPAAQASWAPSGPSSIATPPNVAYIDSSALPGYDGLRATAFTIPASAFQAFIDGNTESLVPPLPVNSTVRMTALTYNNGD